MAHRRPPPRALCARSAGLAPTDLREEGRKRRPSFFSAVACFEGAMTEIYSASFVVSAIACAALVWKSNSIAPAASVSATPAFRAFQRNYLTVYLLATFAVRSMRRSGAFDVPHCRTGSRGRMCLRCTRRTAMTRATSPCFSSLDFLRPSSSEPLSARSLISTAADSCASALLSSTLLPVRCHLHADSSCFFVCCFLVDAMPTQLTTQASRL